MLRVTVELVRFGNENDVRKIATMLIANDGTGGYEVGNYAYAYEYNDYDGMLQTGTVKNFHRRNGAWELIKKILNKRKSETDELTDLLVKRLNSYKE